MRLRARLRLLQICHVGEHPGNWTKEEVEEVGETVREGKIPSPSRGLALACPVCGRSTGAGVRSGDVFFGQSSRQWPENFFWRYTLSPQPMAGNERGDFLGLSDSPALTLPADGGAP